MHKKWVLVPVAAAAVGLGALGLTTSPVSAHGAGLANHDTMVARLAQAFGKSESEVRSVFEQIHTEHQAARLAELTAKLDAGVSAGQITSDQKQLILAKFATLKTEHQEAHEAWKASGEKPTLATFKANRQDHRAELVTWATDNGISTEFLSSLLKRPTEQQ